jgi:hypothetical protein
MKWKESLEIVCPKGFLDGNLDLFTVDNQSDRLDIEPEMGYENINPTVPSNNHARGYVSVEENKVFFPKKEE